MTRNDAVGEAAIFGLVGTVLISTGGLIASFLFSRFGLWIGVVPALLVWGLFLYLGMKQFAHGIYAVVEDAQA